MLVRDAGALGDHEDAGNRPLPSVLPEQARTVHDFSAHDRCQQTEPSNRPPWLRGERGIIGQDERPRGLREGSILNKASFQLNLTYVKICLGQEAGTR